MSSLYFLLKNLKNWMLWVSFINEECRPTLKGSIKIIVNWLNSSFIINLNFWNKMVIYPHTLV